MVKFFTKEGWLTPYALSCGYKHVNENDVGYASLSHCNGNVYDVKHYSNEGERVWDQIEGINAARKRYRELCVKLSKRDTTKYEQQNGAPKRAFT